MSTAVLDPGNRAALLFRNRASNLTITLQGEKRRYTYRLDPTTKPGRWWVHVLTGADNGGDYTFLGGLYEKSGFFRSGRSPVGEDAESVKAFLWFAKHMEATELTVLLARPCIRCGQKLTTTKSILRGMGPDCARQYAGVS